VVWFFLESAESLHYLVELPQRKTQKIRPILIGAEEQVRQVYRKLAQAWGAQHWWPAEGPFEVIVGAILTQNTSWTNVERAMAKLREAGALNPEGIRNLPLSELEQLIRSSGYFRQKAQRLKDFVAFLDAKYDGSLERMFATPSPELRAELLTQKGIGMETADSILLYAGLHPVFVVDAYTRRVFERHEIVSGLAKYDDLRRLVEQALTDETVPGAVMEAAAGSRPAVHLPSRMSTAQQSRQTRVYNEMHGLLVQVGKHYCEKRQPKCEMCPLGELLSTRQRVRLRAGADINRRVTRKAQ
jgi:endonuclease-3 related protein